MDAHRLAQLQIEPSAKRRPQRMLALIFVSIALLTLATAILAWPRASDKVRRLGGNASITPTEPSAAAAVPPSLATNSTPANATDDGTVLTVSGYIINRERIELSPRFLGVVKWIGVKKGDAVTNGQVVVVLDDAEYKARLAESEARLASAKVALERAQLNYERIARLGHQSVESQQMVDDSRLNLAAAKATLAEVEGQTALIRTYIDWTIIRSPINGVVLEKLVNPNELVVPQSFGGGGGPSTALLAVADPNDLQVEIDVNESDLPKVFLHQGCRVSPEAYPDKHYDGLVAEMAPEASRQKGTLQLKVQILKPDKYLTPQLSAKVDFLAGPTAAKPN